MLEQSEPGATSRWQFLKHVGVIGGSTAVALTTGVEIKAKEAPSTTTAVPVRNDTMRMVKDLDRTLARPIDARRWGMVIDSRRCSGCHACTAACIAENRLPAGVSYRSVAEVESGTFPTLQRFFMPTNCMQCDNAPCVAAANGVASGAIGRRPDGIVTIDYNRMKGRAVFEAASKACPIPRHSTSMKAATGRTVRLHCSPTSSVLHASTVALGRAPRPRARSLPNCPRAQERGTPW